MKRILVLAVVIMFFATMAFAADKSDPALGVWQQKVEKVMLEKENAILRMQIMQSGYQQQQAIFQQKEKELKALEASKPGAKKEEKKAK